MRFSQTLVTLALVAARVTAQEKSLGDAEAVTNNPPGAVYKANFMSTTLWDTHAGGPVGAEVIAMSSINGSGVTFKLALQNLPKEGGPFLYHLHVNPVPENGNCTATLAHLDPYSRGEDTPCDLKNPQTCQVGDLSGKHGKAEGATFTTSFTDDYASLVDGLGSFFGNRSIVIHFANKTRIACGNFSMVTSPTTVTYSDETRTTTATYYSNGTMPTASFTTSSASGTGDKPTPTATGTTTVPSGGAATAKVPAALLSGASLTLAALILII